MHSGRMRTDRRLTVSLRVGRVVCLVGVVGVSGRGDVSVWSVGGVSGQGVSGQGDAPTPPRVDRQMPVKT